MCRRDRRPLRIRPRMMTDASSRGSMLPPDSTTPTVRPANRSRCSTRAAMPAAPAPSVTTFSISRSRLMPSSMWSSVTVTTSSTSASMIRPVSVAGARDGDALGHRRAADGGRRVVHVIGHRRVALGLHADELDVGPQVAGDDGHARQQAAAADGDDERVELGVVGQQLEGARALAGDDGRVVEGVDVGAALVGGQRARPRPRPRRCPRPAARPWRPARGCAAPSRTACWWA